MNWFCFQQKHKVLVSKCYPRYQKSVLEVKPNSSELSYLLYYATTRRTKLQKVGAFLEKKTGREVRKQRLGNVQVTLQILTALIEKAPKDLPLYGNSVLRILDTVLRSEDIDMVEESVPTWAAYCKYQKPLTLGADKALSQQYRYILDTYADFGSETHWQSKKVTPTKPIQIRWKKVSVQAIKAAVDSQCLGVNKSEQLGIVIPAILETIYSDGEDNLSYLQDKAQLSEKVDTASARKRRMSMTTVATVDTVDADPASASGTADDADKVAEEEVRIVAIRALKHVFATGNEYSMTRSQIRNATALTLRFIANKNPPRPSLDKPSPRDKQENWATSLIEAVTEWTPMQERYAIPVTATEILVRCPITKSKIEVQLTLVTMIGWLLSSSIYLLGLSPMDILLRLIRHILSLLQPGSRSSSPNRYAIDIFHDAMELFDEDAQLEHFEEPPEPRMREELLRRLHIGILDLAAHTYYSGQVSDMISALQARLIDPPGASSETRETGREAIKDLMGVANRRENVEKFSVRIRL